MTENISSELQLFSKKQPQKINVGIARSLQDDTE